jgi:hypothetical protein
MKNENWRKKQLEYIQSKYESSKKIAEEIWLDGDYEGTPNDFYYFQYGFVAGMNYESQQKRLEALQKLSDLDQEMGIE